MQADDVFRPFCRGGDAVYVEPAKITSADDGGTFEIEFAVQTRARVVRLVMTDFETDAPAIRKVRLSNTKGETVLPTRQDFMALRRNDTLEIVPGDKVRITYDDPAVITESKQSHTSTLTATFTDAEISACFVDYQRDRRTGERIPRYTPMRRFTVGDRINVFINDPDRDHSAEKDSVDFTAKTYDGNPIRLQAVETQPHSGVFLGVVFPVEGQPTRNSELTVGPNEDVVLTYIDEENTDPGIRWPRTSVVEQAWQMEPELRVYDVKSQPLSEQQQAQAERRQEEQSERFLEFVPIRKTLVAQRPERADVSQAVIHVNGPLIAELTYPTIALAPDSVARIYAQTGKARELVGKQPGDPFDLNVPGTVKLVTTPRDVDRIEAPQGYADVIVRGNPFAMDPLDDGRFMVKIPTELAPVPKESFAFADDEAARVGYSRRGDQRKLAIQGNDTIYVGFRYETPEGRERWVTQKVTLTGDVFFDIMDRRYQEPMTGAYVGENLYFRMIHPTYDTSDDKDVLTVQLQASTSGESRTLRLMETFGHSGVFKGVIRLLYMEEQGVMDQDDVLPVAYGDTVVASYQPSGYDAPIQRTVEVFKGADGEVLQGLVQEKLEG